MVGYKIAGIFILRLLLKEYCVESDMSAIKSTNTTASGTFSYEKKDDTITVTLDSVKIEYTDSKSTKHNLSFNGKITYESKDGEDSGDYIDTITVSDFDYNGAGYKGFSATIVTDKSESTKKFTSAVCDDIELNLDIINACITLENFFG